MVRPYFDFALGEKVAFLKDSESYLDETEPPETRETHMSWVFLLDKVVYKLKKPVLHDYLDFSTIDSRHRGCLREVELNRRLAPQVYLGAVPLVATSEGTLALESQGQIVDYLVKMHRLPAESFLDARIARGSVERPLLEKAVHRLCGFYRNAERIQISPSEHRRNIESDIRYTLASLVDSALDLPVDLISEVSARQSGFLASHWSLLDRRVRDGRIVEAHGDLRPQHVSLSQDPLFIDCLEFNRSFRLLDPAHELAFLAMECDRLGAPEVGDLILEIYAESLEDPVAGELLLFYRSFKAMIRARLAIWHLKDPEVARPEKWLLQSREYIGLAAGYLENLRD